MSKKILFAAALASLLATPALAQTSGEGPWLVRARAVHIDSANKDSTGLGLSVNNKWIPEVDVSYFFTPNIAAELILTYPQKHTVRSSVLGGDIGSLKHLPPTLTVQYHFTNSTAFTPYVGAGLNYTRFSSVNVAGGAADVKRNSFGPALQIGASYALTKNLSLNLDVKKVWIKTDVSVGGVKQGTFKVDPVLVGLGVGYRF
ncbi:MAG: OmpW family outer membrane protein [Pseudomonadota bacterium]|nr:OmpW family outer membrane protein [Pseudomonadota bacterium]